MFLGMGIITNASSIDLSGKCLNDVPAYIFKCKNLKSLNLSNNNLQEIPIELCELKALKKVDLSNNLIKQVYSKLFLLSGLEVLNLNNNKIKNIPKQIGNLKSLKSLHISGNELQSLPSTFVDLEQLRNLNISNNNFGSFPKELLQLHNLVRLWIGKNDFQSIPIFELNDNLRKLKSLYAFNPILNDQKLDRNTALLGKHKGNRLDDLRLMTYQASSNEFRKPLRDTAIRNSKTIFISYSHADEKYKEEVLKTLRGLKNVYQDIDFDVWSDDRIRPGQRWLEEIENALDRAAIAILIVSRDFLGSEFIMKNEIPQILRNADQKGVLIMNLVAGKSIFANNMVISEFQCVNDPNEPLKSLSDHQQDVIYTKLAEEVKNCLQEMES